MTLLKTEAGTAGFTYSSFDARIANLGISVKDNAYGAQGNGTTNDTAAINTAIAAASALGSATKRIRVYFPDGTYLTDGILAKANVWIDFGNAHIKKSVDGTSLATNSIIRTVQTFTGLTYYGTYTNIKITGGRLDTNGHTCPASVMSLLYTDGLIIDGVTVVHTSANRNTAIYVGGTNGQVTNCRVLGGTLFFQDGIHMAHGQYWRMADNYIECGDDALAMGVDPATETYVAADPDPLRYVTWSNNVVNSKQGHAIRLFVGVGATSPLWEISDVTYDGITGSAGIERNGGFFFEDQNNPVAGGGLIKRINVQNVELKVGSTAHQDLNACGMNITATQDVTFSNIALQITDKTAATLGFDLCLVSACEDVTINNLRCGALQKRYGVSVIDSNRVTVKNCRLVGTTATALNAMRFDDVTDLKVLDNVILEVKDGASGVLITTGTTTNGLISGNTVKQVSGATTGQAVGVVSSAFTHLTVEHNDFTGSFQGSNTASLFTFGKALVRGNRNLADYGLLGPRIVQTVATNVDFTLTIGTSGEHVLHTGTLTADRAVTLATTGAFAGMATKITRTGPGAFNLNVGTGPLKALATGTWCEVMYSGSAWVLTSYGAL